MCCSSAVGIWGKPWGDAKHPGCCPPSKDRGLLACRAVMPGNPCGMPEESEGSHMEWDCAAICLESEAAAAPAGLQGNSEERSLSLLSPIRVSSSSGKQGKPVVGLWQGGVVVLFRKRQTEVFSFHLPVCNESHF